MVRRVTKRKVTKRRKKKQSVKAQLGGGEKHYCLYSTLDSEGNHVDGCPNYYFKPTSCIFLIYASDKICSIGYFTFGKLIYV